MNKLDERVAHLEGKVEEHRLMVDDIRSDMARMEARIDARFQSLEQRVDSRCGAIERRMDRLEQKVDRLAHLMIAMLLSIIAGMGGIIAAILGS